MAAKVTNPRFPHKCVIYRNVGATSFNPNGETVELYNGVCRKSGSTNIRTFSAGSNSTGKVDMADYRISVPGIVNNVRKGDIIDVTDLAGVERNLRIVKIECSTLCKTVVEDAQGNSKTVVGGTAYLCSTSSN